MKELFRTKREKSAEGAEAFKEQIINMLREPKVMLGWVPEKDNVC